MKLSRSVATTANDLFAGIRQPLLCAPMTAASGLPLTLACCEAGAIGG
jgi:hypothetical protein